MSYGIGSVFQSKPLWRHRWEKFAFVLWKRQASITCNDGVPKMWCQKIKKGIIDGMLLLLPPCWCQLHANTRRVTYESSLWLRMAISNGIVFYSIHHTCLRKNNIVQQWLLVNEAACSWWSANSWKVVDMTSDNQAWCAKHKLSTKLRDPDWPIMTRAIHTIHTMTSMRRYVHIKSALCALIIST